MKVRLAFLLSISVVGFSIFQTEALRSATFIWANRPNGPFKIAPITCPLPGYPTCGSVTKVPGGIIYADGDGNVASYLNPIAPSNAPVLILVKGNYQGGNSGLWQLNFDLYNRTANVVQNGYGESFGHVYVTLLDAFGIAIWPLDVAFDREGTCEQGPQKAPSYIPNDIIANAAQYTVSQDHLWTRIKPC